MAECTFIVLQAAIADDDKGPRRMKKNFWIESFDRIQERIDDRSIE